MQSERMHTQTAAVWPALAVINAAPDVTSTTPVIMNAIQQ